MPVIAVGVERLNQLLGQAFDMDRLVEALEDLGCDVEDTAEVVHYLCPSCDAINELTISEAAPRRCDFCGVEHSAPLVEQGRRSVIRLELQADRPDLFDTGGLVRALRGTLGGDRGLPRYVVHAGNLVVLVDPRLSEPASYRPYICCAVVYMPPITAETLREIMRFQESLHWGIGRDRKLASIGVYDLDGLVGPIRYTTIEPNGLKFSPLAYPDRPMSAREILTQHPKGMAYAHLLEDLTAYPLLIDGNGQVLSMPPIINSDETRVRIGSTRLFLDVTGISEDATRNALLTLTCSLAELGGDVYNITVRHPDGREEVQPDLSPRVTEIDSAKVRGWLGLQLSDAEIVELFRKMRLDATRTEAGRIRVEFPAFRSDIRHPVDLYADVGIGFGYRNVPPALLSVNTRSSERPEERLGKLARNVLVGLGYWEVTSLVLGSEEGLFSNFRLDPGDTHVTVANPKTLASAVARPHLMAGVMETLARNKRKAAPLRFFEEGNAILLDDARETGTHEQRRITFAVMGPDAGYAEARATADALARDLGVQLAYRPDSHPSFVDGRCAWAADNAGGELCGRLGEVHPEVLERFGLPFPVALGEMTLCRVL